MNNELSILIKLDPDGWIRKIYLFAENDQSEKIVTKALNRILKKSCHVWIHRLITRAGAMF
jgi:hypothetical protein